MCKRHTVRFKEILVWRTHGMVINAAVLGFLAPFRYVLLTDALLESLPSAQVEAVMAHEIGHVRKRHMPWLLATMIAAIGFVSSALVYLYELALHAHTPTSVAPYSQPLIIAISTIAGLLVFGWVSRRFERHADAFAVQHLSGVSATDPDSQRAPITEDAALTMSAALAAVADLNHVPQRRWTWRHGSILGRRRAILTLATRRADQLPIDRSVRAIKSAVFLLFALTLALSLLSIRLQQSSQAVWV